MRISVMKLVGVFALAALCAPTALADTIILKGKPAITGAKVQKETLLEVSYTQGNSTRRKTVPSSEVLEVIYDAPPVQYRQGVEYFNLGDYVNAIARFKASLSAETEGRPWLKEYASIYLGRAYLASQNYSEAVKTLQGVLADKPEGRRFGLVSMRLALAQSALGSKSAALTALDNLQSILKQKQVKGLLSLHAELVRGEVLIEAKDYDGAVAAMKALAIKSVVSDPRADLAKTAVYVRARSLQGEAGIAGGDTRQAGGVFDDLRTRGGGTAVAMAATRTGRAAVILAEKPDSEELLKAKGLLTKALAENFTAVSELPRTCYLLGLVHLKLDGTLSGAKTLAKSYLEETVRRFPETREAFRAREQLKKM